MIKKRGKALKKLYYRSYQTVMKFATKVIPWRDPELLTGPSSLLELPKKIKEDQVKRVLIVTDEGIMDAGLVDQLIEKLAEERIRYYIYDQTVPNPTIENIEAATQIYRANNCEGIIAFGGGSPIDCAKLTGACVVKPKKSVEKLRGLFKVFKQLPPLYVVPTTSGTGAEATLAAVFSNEETNEKHPVMDTALIPHVAVLDPLVTMNLPRQITAETGMDALTHAVEAYIGRSNTKETKEWSMQATKLIFDNLYETYENGSNIKARENMQRAAHLAGKAFTRAYVGYVHAIAHQLGGFYNMPHGLANAIVLPHVLKYYGEVVYDRLAELADVIGITEANDSYIQKGEKFIQAIKDLNHKLAIPNQIEHIEEEHIPIMIERALREANPLYPVPKILKKDDLSQLFYLIKE